MSTWKPKTRTEYPPSAQPAPSPSTRSTRVKRFPVSKVNAKGKEQKRELVLSSEGLANSGANGGKVQWFVPAAQVYSVEPDASDRLAVTVSLIYPYTFRALSGAARDAIVESAAQAGFGPETHTSAATAAHDAGAGGLSFYDDSATGTDLLRPSGPASRAKMSAAAASSGPVTPATRNNLAQLVDDMAASFADLKVAIPDSNEISFTTSNMLAALDTIRDRLASVAGLLGATGTPSSPDSSAHAELPAAQSASSLMEASFGSSSGSPIRLRARARKTTIGAAKLSGGGGLDGDSDSDDGDGATYASSISSHLGGVLDAIKLATADDTDDFSDDSDSDDLAADDGGFASVFLDDSVFAELDAARSSPPSASTSPPLASPSPPPASPSGPPPKPTTAPTPQRTASGSENSCAASSGAIDERKRLSTVLARIVAKFESDPRLTPPQQLTFRALRKAEEHPRSRYEAVYGVVAMLDMHLASGGARTVPSVPPIEALVEVLALMAAVRAVRVLAIVGSQTTIALFDAVLALPVSRPPSLITNLVMVFIPLAQARGLASEVLRPLLNSSLVVGFIRHATQGTPNDHLLEALLVLLAALAVDVRFRTSFETAGAEQLAIRSLTECPNARRIQKAACKYLYNVCDRESLRLKCGGDGLRGLVATVNRFLSDARVVEFGLAAIGQVVMRTELNQSFFFDAAGLPMLHDVFATHAACQPIIMHAVQVIRRLCSSADVRPNFSQPPELALLVSAIASFPTDANINKDAEYVLRVLLLQRDEKDRILAVDGVADAIAAAKALLKSNNAYI